VDDQKAVDLIKGCETAQKASDLLLKYALENFTNDNVTVLVTMLGSSSENSNHSFWRSWISDRVGGRR
jgi:protein phosphatase PTC1